MKTVHIVFNAHLDPVWLWSWRDGLDEVLNTARYICRLLDRNPDIVYTRGEAWLYEQIRLVEPALFAHIVRHIRAGRWSPVGGWYIQPDCNLPSGFALRKQIALGKEWFRAHLGAFPKVGYNVDSFGHAASLPGYLREAGQDSYVMMRPQENEMALPARLFRWRGHAGGPEVTTFRIAKAYCTPEGLTEEHVRASATELPEGIGHTMCFVGIGDHGGGPTEEMIAWCREHRDCLAGLRLVFSSPARFFAAVRRDLARLPLVTGELQMHAVGCYSVHRATKVALRRAEHALAQTESLVPRPGAEDGERLARAWRRVCFHHFHDTLGGTCLPSAYRDVEAQLGEALATADEVAALALRRQLARWGDDPAQRLVLHNASELPFDGHAEIEPWIEWSAWHPSWRLVDERGRAVRHQAITPESTADNQVRLLFRIAAKPGETRVVRIVERPQGKPPASAVTATKKGIASPQASVRFGQNPHFVLAGTRFALPVPSLYDDPSDTWSHGIDRYERRNGHFPTWAAPLAVDEGPLMASAIRQGTLEGSELREEWRVYADAPWVDYFLRVVWNGKRAVLKLDWRLPAPVAEREDGILGGSLRRPADERELPLRDWTLLGLGKVRLGIVAPDVFALDVSKRAAGLTLLRGAVMACHEPNLGLHPRAVFSDRGEHLFRFRFQVGPRLNAATLDRAAFAWHRPLLTAELTRGMINRACRSRYAPPRG